MLKKINNHISIKGAKIHNLKNISVDIPKNKLVIITGLSGSGKSSLAFNTIYAEGQRRYVESLSSYARQFLGRLKKPNVESITGLSPAIAIEQKVNSKNPRSTVGTSTEIYDYLKLFFARIGKTISPISNKEVSRHSVSNVIEYILNTEEGTLVYILSKITANDNISLKKKIYNLEKQGFARIKINNTIKKIREIDNSELNNEIFLVIDRVKIKKNSRFRNRLADSIETSFYEGEGKSTIEFPTKKKTKTFSNKFELDGIKFTKPSINFFSFNNPIGACIECEGYGSTIDVDETLVVPNMNLSVYENAIVCWRGEKLSKWKKKFIELAHKSKFPVHKAYKHLNKKEKDILWNGNSHCKGINDFFDFVESKSYKIQFRVLLSRYKGKTKCKICHGNRLKKETRYVKINKKSINDLINLSIEELYLFFKTLKLSNYDKKVIERILTEINTRIEYLLNVGLGYLTLNRESSTLSSGESQRINLATALGSSLVGSLYILDEPSIGLHSNDTSNLIKVLYQLRDLGNTIIVVEHDEEIIRTADYIIDLGKEAGINGGNIIFNGSFNELLNDNSSYTAKYLKRNLNIKIPKKRNLNKELISIKGVFENNLQDIDVNIPLNCLSVVTGVSGSGKSSLVQRTLYPAILNKLGIYTQKPGKFSSIEGTNFIDKVELVNQNPIGKSSRSNPVTYLKIYDDIRELYSKDKLSILKGFQPKHFSFNVAGGRCDNCQGEGRIKIEMQFMADVYIICDECNGMRFKKEILQIKIKNKNIYDILKLSVDEAILFFKSIQEDKIQRKMKPLEDVGLGYIQLGQSSNTLSGGEAQRVKLAYFLSKVSSKEKTLFIFDEPTTGLHFHDVNKLIQSFNALLESGNSILVVEHNMEIIKCADYIIDLGPGGGKNGGKIVYSGSIEDFMQSNSLTGKYLKKYIKQRG